MTGQIFKKRLQYENLRSLAFGSIGASYVIVGTAFANPISVFKIYNGTNQDVLFSTDGTNNKDVIPAGANFVLDITTNKSGEHAGLFFRKGDAVFIKQGAAGAPTSGSVFVTSLFAG